MKVLLVNVQIGSGSVGTIVSDLYHGIQAHGDECKIAYSRGNAKEIPIEDTIKIGNTADIYIHALLTRIFGKTATYSRVATAAFLKAIDKYNPDVIHIHGLYGYYINMEMLFKYIKAKDIILISTLHSCWDFTGHCCYFEFADCSRWKVTCNPCPQKTSYPRSSFLDNTSKNLERKARLYHDIKKVVIVSPSKWMDGLVAKSRLGDLEHVIINNGINTAVFKPTIDDDYINKLGLSDKYPTILCVASLWDRRKGLDDIVEMAEQYRKEKINIVVVGLSKKQIKRMPRNIIGLKRTENLNQLISLYSYATVLFNPTYEDNYPTVNLEAIACGTPVITYNTGGSREIVEKSGAGAVIKKKDYEQLIKLTKKYYLENFTKINRTTIEDIDSCNMVKKYLYLYMMTMEKYSVGG